MGTSVIYIFQAVHRADGRAARMHCAKTALQARLGRRELAPSVTEVGSIYLTQAPSMVHCTMDLTSFVFPL
jgi:hypothetical protein